MGRFVQGFAATGIARNDEKGSIPDRARADLRLRVELKKPRSYEEAMEIAKRKEWKLSMDELNGCDGLIAITYGDEETKASGAKGACGGVAASGSANGSSSGPARSACYGSKSSGR